MLLLKLNLKSTHSHFRNSNYSNFKIDFQNILWFPLSSQATTAILRFAGEGKFKTQIIHCWACRFCFWLFYVLLLSLLLSNLFAEPIFYLDQTNEWKLACCKEFRTHPDLGFEPKTVGSGKTMPMPVNDDDRLNKQTLWQTVRRLDSRQKEK